VSDCADEEYEESEEEKSEASKEFYQNSVKSGKKNLLTDSTHKKKAI
jgi:hypothetical protein